MMRLTVIFRPCKAFSVSLTYTRKHNVIFAIIQDGSSFQVWDLYETNTMRRFILPILLFIVGLGIRVTAWSDLSPIPASQYLTIQTSTISSPAFSLGESDALPELELRLAQEWLTASYPITHPLQAPKYKKISAWFPPALPWFLATLGAFFGVNQVSSLFLWLNIVCGSLIPPISSGIFSHLRVPLVPHLAFSFFLCCDPVLVFASLERGPGALGSTVALLVFFCCLPILSRGSSLASISAAFLIAASILISSHSFLPMFFILTRCLQALGSTRSGWIPATLLLLVFLNTLIPWHWKVISHQQGLVLLNSGLAGDFFLTTCNDTTNSNELNHFIKTFYSADFEVLSSPNTSEAKRVRWLIIESLNRISKYPGLWLSRRSQAVSDSLFGNLVFWQKRHHNAGGVVLSCIVWSMPLLLLLAGIGLIRMNKTGQPAKLLQLVMIGWAISLFLHAQGADLSGRLALEPWLIILAACGFMKTETHPLPPCSLINTHSRENC